MQAISLQSLVIAFAMVFAIHPLCQAVEINRGMMLSHSCAGCHGTDGRSPGSIPSIQGKSAKFIATALREFRDGSRAATVMGRHAMGYTDEEIDLIAQHFATVH